MTCIADADIAEALVCHLWCEQLPRKQRLRLADGRQVRVYQTGTLNQDSGPDFLNAELAFGPGQPIRGDVEVHIRPSDWYRHGHETDPRYNTVILHVVMWDDEGDASVLKQNGQRVPNLVLSESLKGSFDRLRRRYERGIGLLHTVYPCEHMAERSSTASLRHLLAEAGEARFLLKARAYEARLASVSPEQALYEGLMEAAGYTKNTAPFRELAERLPIAVLRSAVHGLPTRDRLSSVQALLFGSAGLLPSQGEGTFPSVVPSGHPYSLVTLEAHWTALSDVHPIPPMEATAWRFFRLRPFNFPTVRLAGLSYLVAAGLSEGLADAFLAVLDEQEDRLPVRRLRAVRGVLDRLLQHDPTDYWVTHSIWGGGTHTGRSLLIGADRRRDMVVNVILPFLFACARRANRPDRQAAILDMYAIHPKLADNSITRQMTTLIFSRAPDRARLIDSARLQQGLLHIHDRTCHRKDCGHCLMGSASHSTPV